MRYQGLFLIFILTLTLGLQYSYQLFRDHYSDSHDLKKQISGLSEKSHRQELHKELLQGQIEDLRANIFMTLEKKGTKMAWREKQWVNSLRTPASVSFAGSKSVQLLAALQVGQQPLLVLSPPFLAASFLPWLLGLPHAACAQSQPAVQCVNAP